MKKYLIGLVLVLLAFPFLVVGLDSNTSFQTSGVEHYYTTKEQTKGVIHNYQDLSNMPKVNITSLNAGVQCMAIEDCGVQQRMGEPTCFGSYQYQQVVQPRCMNPINASTPPVCLYTTKDIIVEEC